MLKVETPGFRPGPATWLALWVLGLWWVASPFLSYAVHDGALYSGEAIRRLSMHNFDKDPFFMGQTQGNFSIFGLLYAQVTAALDIRLAGFVVATLGRLTWALAAWWLVRTLWPAGQTWVAGLALMLLLPATYDGYALFAYAGPEVTPRCWAEACVLAALAFQLKGRWLPAWGLAVLGAGLHPLMALPGCVVLLLLQPPRVRNLGCVLGLVALGVGAVLNVGPLGQLLVRFDDFWWESAQVLAGYALLPSWPLEGLVKALVWAALLLHVMWRQPDTAQRRLARALLLAGGLLMAGWIVASITRNVLGVQLQTWRVLWLCQLLAPALWAATLPAWRTWTALTWAEVLLVLAGVLSTHAGGAVLVLFGLALAWPAVQHRLAHRSWIGWLPVLAGGLLLWVALGRWPAFVWQDEINHINRLPFARLVSLSHEALWALPVTALLAWVLQKAPSPGMRAAAATVAVLPIVVALGVLQVQWTKASVPMVDARALRKIVPEGALVHWDLGSDHTWFRLHRAQYAATSQGPTSLFSRSSAVEFRRRLEVLDAAGMIGGPELAAPAPGQEQPVQALVRRRAALEQGLRRPIGPENLLRLCADPVLDFVLLSADIPGADHRVPYADAPGGVVSVFTCHR